MRWEKEGAYANVGKKANEEGEGNTGLEAPDENDDRKEKESKKSTDFEARGTERISSSSLLKKDSQFEALVHSKTSKS